MSAILSKLTVEPLAREGTDSVRETVSCLGRTLEHIHQLSSVKINKGQKLFLVVSDVFSRTRNLQTDRLPN